MDFLILKHRKLKLKSLKDDICYLEMQEDLTDSGKQMLMNAKKELKELQEKFGELT